MIRPLTLLSVIAAAGAGLHVYNTKHAVFMLDRELRTIAVGIQEAETRTQALQAEWAWATEQERLRALAQRHLALEPMQPAQFVRFAEAERRLPPPEAHGGPVALFAPNEPSAAGNRTRIALLLPEPAAPGRASPAAPPPAAPVPTLTAVAQAALAAAASKPLPLPAPAAPEAPPVVARTAVALPPLP
ncbi:cell division protein FtsL, partial [Craurococcus roseus]